MDRTKRQITEIAREVNRFTIRNLRKEGIGSSEFDVIHVIRNNPGITQANICKILGFDKGAVARQTASLEAKGYVKKRENPDDSRSHLLVPTEKAEQLKISKAHIEAMFYEWLMDELTEPEQKEFSRLLNILFLKCKEESKANFPQMTKQMECETANEMQ